VSLFEIDTYDLIIYEMMVDDFVSKLQEDDPDRDQKAPLDFVREKVSDLDSLGINAVEFMPLTATLGEGFSWGYDPFLFFAIEDRFVHATAPNNQESLDKLFRLKQLIEALHEAKIHVIFDGVFNHTVKGTKSVGFPYYWFYQYPPESPFIGAFEGGGFFEELDFQNRCTQAFIFDICRYWFDRFQIDGIRFDYTLGYFKPSGLDPGLTRLLHNLNGYLGGTGRKNVALMIEHLTDNRYEAINVANQVGATGCWFDPLAFKTWEFGPKNDINTTLMRPLNSNQDFAWGKGPVVYIENHDHSTVVNKVGGSQMGPHVRPENWAKTQPYAIALFTIPGAVLIHNGQEFGDEYFIPESGDGRVKSRPLNWHYKGDFIGQRLFGIYQMLINIRKDHPALRSPNFYPSNYDEGDRFFNAEGYGVHDNKNVVIYHRWGNDNNEQLERFIVVLNFSASDQYVDVPFPINGLWQDLLNKPDSFTVVNHRLKNQKINSNWGRIYYIKG
jgi:pullulanase